MDACSELHLFSPTNMNITENYMQPDDVVRDKIPAKVEGGIWIKFCMPPFLFGLMRFHL